MFRKNGGLFIISIRYR